MDKTPLHSARTKTSFPLVTGHHRVRGSIWDILAALLVLALITFLASTSKSLFVPLEELRGAPLSLDPALLPFYAARTTLRMFAALSLSLLFTFTYATWAAKSSRAATLLIPILDILQSVPILGFISVSVVFFMSLAPGRVLGAEFAAIFAMFTSQAWNMAFSFFQSLRTLPQELHEAAHCFKLSSWMTFWRIEVPFAMPALIWNMMMSMSGGWFFVVAAEAITVGDTTVILPGIGSYIALAIAQKNLIAIGWAVGTMLIVILIYDQLFFRPLVVWADKFRCDEQANSPSPTSWVVTIMRRSRLIEWILTPVNILANWSFYFFRRPLTNNDSFLTPASKRPWETALWICIMLLIGIIALWYVGRFLILDVTPNELIRVIYLTTLTFLRVMVLIALASIVWVPIGVWVGLHPKAARVVQPIAQFMAAFPANLFFPLAVLGISFYHLSANIWLSPLMILGTQWYILFNVIAGATTLPNQLRDVGANLHVQGWLWWRKIALPNIFPFYVTGAITASGGSWNASIVAELVTWGDQKIKAKGVGAYIAQATTDGDFHKIVLGIGIMSIFVLVFNRFFWRPLYWYAERKFRLE